MSHAVAGMYQSHFLDPHFIVHTHLPSHVHGDEMAELGLNGIACT